MDFCTVADINALFRTLTAAETERAAALIPVVCDTLRSEAAARGKDLDQMKEDLPHYANVLKSVTVDIVSRTLLQSTDSEPMTNVTQSALGYSFSGTYLNAGGGLFIKKSELARLGLRRQICKGVEMF